MKIQIEKTATIHETIELPEFFTSITGWFHRVLPDNKIFQITEEGMNIYGPSSLKWLESLIKPCTVDEFTAAYASALNRLAAASGIEFLPLMDTTSNPES